MKFQRFYQTEGGGANIGEGQPAPVPAPVTQPTGTDVPRPKRTNASDFISKSRVLKSGDTPVAKEGEAAKPEPEKKVLVKGPALEKAKQPVATPPGLKPAEVPKGEGEIKTESGKVKIGDFELSEDEWMDAYNDRKNKSQWQTAHTKKSQIINRFPDEVLNEIVPYVLSQRKLPDNVTEELRKLGNLPEKIKTKDADGYEIEIDTKNVLTDQFLNQVKQHLIVNTFPEYMKIITEHEQMKGQLSELQKTTEAQNLELGVSGSVQFMNEHPDFAVTVMEGQALWDVMANVMTAGETHPEFENARRFGMLLKSIKDGYYRSFDEAYNNIYGEQVRKTAIAEQVKANQKEGAPERPAGTEQKSSGRQMLDRMKGGKADKLKSLNR